MLSCGQILALARATSFPIPHWRMLTSSSMEDSVLLSSCFHSSRMVGWWPLRERDGISDSWRTVLYPFFLVEIFHHSDGPPAPNWVREDRRCKLSEVKLLKDQEFPFKEWMKGRPYRVPLQDKLFARRRPTPSIILWPFASLLSVEPFFIWWIVLVFEPLSNWKKEMRPRTQLIPGRGRMNLRWGTYILMILRPDLSLPLKPLTATAGLSPKTTFWIDPTSLIRGQKT